MHTWRDLSEHRPDPIFLHFRHERQSLSLGATSLICMETVR
jgi:hypothetical protein